MVAGRKITFPDNRQVATLLLLLFFAQKILFFFLYSLRFTDHDQVTVWMMASDHAHGNWSSIFFYGQRYNIALDAIFAAPLIWLKIPPQIAVPLAVLLVNALAVFVAWHYCFRQKKYTSAVLVLLVFLLAPYTLHMQFSMGISLSVGIVLFASVLLLNSPIKNWATHALGLLIAFAALSVPNAIPAAIWTGIYFLLTIKNTRKLIMLFSGFIQGIGWYLVMKYNSEQQHLHGGLDFGFAWHSWVVNVKQIADIFWGMGPVIDYAGILYGFIIILIALKYRKKNMALFYANAAWLIAVFYILGMPKATDGHLNAYFPYLRFYLSLVAILILNFLVVLPEIHAKSTRIVWVISGISGVAIFFADFGSSLKHHARRNISTGIETVTGINSRLQDPCLMKLFSGGSMVVSQDDPSLMYAAQACNSGANTLYLPYDRREKKYLNFFRSKITGFYLWNRHILHNDTQTAHVKLRNMDNCKGLARVELSGITAGSAMEELGWEYYLNVGQK